MLVITGCDTGLGYSWANYGHELGFQVVAGVLNEESEGSKDLKKREIFVLPLDITSNESIEKFAEGLQNILLNKKFGTNYLLSDAVFVSGCYI